MGFIGSCFSSSCFSTFRLLLLFLFLFLFPSVGSPADLHFTSNNNNNSTALNTQLGNEVAVRKIAKASLDRVAAERLSNELFVLRQLRHENVRHLFLNLPLPLHFV